MSLSLRTRVARLERQRGSPHDSQWRLDLLSCDELNLMVIYVCRTTLENPHASPHERAEAEEELAKRQPLPCVDKQRIAAIVELISGS